MICMIFFSHFFDIEAFSFDIWLIKWHNFIICRISIFFTFTLSFHRFITTQWKQPSMKLLRCVIFPRYCTTAHIPPIQHGFSYQLSSISWFTVLFLYTLVHVWPPMFWSQGLFHQNYSMFLIQYFHSKSFRNHDSGSSQN